MNVYVTTYHYEYESSTLVSVLSSRKKALQQWPSHRLSGDEARIDRWDTVRGVIVEVVAFNGGYYGRRDATASELEDMTKAALRDIPDWIPMFENPGGVTCFWSGPGVP